MSVRICMCFFRRFFTYEDFATLCFKLKNLKYTYMQIVYFLRTLWVYIAIKTRKYQIKCRCFIVNICLQCGRLIVYNVFCLFIGKLCSSSSNLSAVLFINYVDIIIIMFIVLIIVVQLRYVIYQTEFSVKGFKRLKVRTHLNPYQVQVE